MGFPQKTDTERSPFDEKGCKGSGAKAPAAGEGLGTLRGEQGFPVTRLDLAKEAGEVFGGLLADRVEGVLSGIAGRLRGTTWSKSTKKL